MKFSTRFLILASVVLAVFSCKLKTPSAESPSPSPSPAASPSSSVLPKDGPSVRVAPDKRSENHMQQIEAELGLTSEQSRKLREHLESQRQVMVGIRDDQKLTPEQKQAKFQETIKAGDLKLAVIFTPEQKAKWEQIMESIRQAMMARQARQGSASPLPSKASSPTHP